MLNIVIQNTKHIINIFHLNATILCKNQYDMNLRIINIKEKLFSFLIPWIIT